MLFRLPDTHIYSSQRSAKLVWWMAVAATHPVFCIQIARYFVDPQYAPDDWHRL